jgi:hypothetical protein
MKPTPMKPKIIIAQVEASGTADEMTPCNSKLGPALVIASGETIESWYRPPSKVSGPSKVRTIDWPLPPAIFPVRLALKMSAGLAGLLNTTSKSKNPVPLPFPFATKLPRSTGAGRVRLTVEFVTPVNVRSLPAADEAKLVQLAAAKHPVVVKVKVVAEAGTEIEAIAAAKPKAQIAFIIFTPKFKIQHDLRLDTGLSKLSIPRYEFALDKMCAESIRWFGSSIAADRFADKEKPPGGGFIIRRGET